MESNTIRRISIVSDLSLYFKKGMFAFLRYTSKRGDFMLITTNGHVCQHFSFRYKSAVVFTDEVDACFATKVLGMVTGEVGSKFDPGKLAFFVNMRVGDYSTLRLYPEEVAGLIVSELVDVCLN